MADVRTYLKDRQNLLEGEIAKLRAQLIPLERELFEIKIAQRALGRQSNEPSQQPLFAEDGGGSIDEEAAAIWRQYKAVEAERVLSPYARSTIKELVLRALTEQFWSGATAQQLLDLFADAWGRPEIVRTSLSPQLSRLKAEHKIDRNGTLWFIRDPKSEKAATDQ